MEGTPAPERKAALRRRLRSRRARRVADLAAAAADAEGLAGTAMAQAPLQRATRVAGYLALPGEPDPRLLLAQLGTRGVEVVLPVLPVDAAGNAARGPLAWARSGPAAPGPALASGVRVDQPTGPSSPSPGPVEVVLVPALAADTAGTRLGQGGGYYDRTLAALDRLVCRDATRTRTLLVAVVHDDELLDARTEPLPREPHDHRVDAVLTPTRWWTVP